MTQPPNYMSDQEMVLIGQTNFRNRQTRFGMKMDDRRRHTYISGKTGMGKSTLLEGMIFQDIQAGHGLAVVDPHGDLAEKVLDFIPAHRPPFSSLRQHLCRGEHIGSHDQADAQARLVVAGSVLLPGVAGGLGAGIGFHAVVRGVHVVDLPT